MSSIRHGLTVRLLCTLGLMMAAVAVALFLGVRAALVGQFDATLRARLATLESATRWDGARLDLDYISEAMPWYQPGADAEYFEIHGPTGTTGLSAVVAKSPSLGVAEFNAGSMEGGATCDVRLPDGRRGRMATKVIKPPPEEDYDEPGREAERAQIAATTPIFRVTVAMSRGGLDAALRTVGVGLLLATGVMGVGLIAGVRMALRAGLAPLRKLSADVEQVRADTLSARLPGKDLPDELRPMHARLNELIERLEVAFTREQRFASAAAHELRTPVAELRSLLEVSVSRPRTAESARETAEEALGITIRMESLVHSLLALARHSAPTEASPLPTVALGPVLVRCTQRFEAEAVRRGGGLECFGGETCLVRADPTALESMLSNVFTNAVEYAEPIPAIRCEVRADGHGSIRIDITNPVVGIEQEDVARFFEPFWRRSESRTDQKHLGLGLALARALAQSSGGDIAASVDGGLVQVRIVLPGEIS